MNPVVQIIVDTLVKNLEPLFVTKTVGQLMFEGYEDELLNITSALNVSEFHVPFDKFGWFYPVRIKRCVRNSDLLGFNLSLQNQIFVMKVNKSVLLISRSATRVM
jgi:hypothetical protein